MVRIFLFSLSFAAFLLTFSPLSASAAGLVPCGRTSDDNATTINEGAPCTVCHVIVGGKGIIDWGLRIMTYVAIAVIVAMAIFYIVSAGNEGMMQKAKSGITASLIGFAIMLGAWLIVNIVLNILTTGGTVAGLTKSDGAFTFTCDMRSLVGSPTGTSVNPGTVPVPTPPPRAPAPSPVTGGAACTDPNAFRANLTNGGKVCNTNCPSTACRSQVLSQYGAVIDQNGGAANRNVIAAIICRESQGNPSARSFDGGCGLMQITNSAWTGSCPATILDPQENIRQGVALYNQKLSAVQGRSYGGGITAEQMAFAAYNCCANGDNPNAPSASCRTADGWPTLPKWACPIDPGVGTFNMCNVKNYACDVSACAL